MQAEQRKRRGFVNLLGIVSKANVCPVVAVHHRRTAVEVDSLNSHICHVTPCSRSPIPGKAESYVRSTRARFDHFTTM